MASVTLGLVLACSIDDMKSSLTQSSLDALCEKFHIPYTVHPELPGRNQRIPVKVSHFEIQCRVHGFVLTVGNFYRFYINSKNKEMDLFAFINHADPTKVRIGEKQNKEGQTLLLESTRGRVVTLAGENPVEAGIVRIEDEVPSNVIEKAKGSRKKRKTARGASGGGGTDSVTRPNLRTQHPVERFVVLSDSPGHSSSNAADAKVSSVVMSLVPDPPIMTTAIATMDVAAASSVPVPRTGDEPVHASIFADSTSAGMAGLDIAGPSQPTGTEFSTDTFYVSQDMDSKTLRQIYVPK
ncbi:hypothetical protein Tco_1133446 [Tanacetum coccineum]